MASNIPAERITKIIYMIRGQKIMLDRDLAELYGVQTKVLKQAVRRNISRFPNDFMFELTDGEFQNWRSQIVTSKSDRMGLRYKPMAFTEQGVTMLFFPCSWLFAPCSMPLEKASYGKKSKRKGVSGHKKNNRKMIKGQTET